MCFSVSEMNECFCVCACVYFSLVLFSQPHHQKSTKLNKKWANKTKTRTGKIRRRTFKCTYKYDGKKEGLEGETEVKIEW